MREGFVVYQDIQSKEAEARKSYERVAGEVTALESRIDGLHEERDRTYDKLARLYLPEMTAEAIRGTLDELRATVTRIYESKQERRTSLETVIEVTRSRRKELEETFGASNRALETVASELERKKSAVATELDGSSEHRTATSELGALREACDRNRVLYASFNKMAKEKLVAYESEPTFMYLVKHGWGTPDYKATGLTRFMDGFVAKVVRFVFEKEKYDSLVSLPAAIEAELVAAGRQVSAAEERLAKLVAVVEETHGVPPVVAKLSAEQGRRAALAKTMKEEDAALERYKKERNALDNTKDAYHADALGKLKSFLTGETIASLKRRALATPSPEDDRLVARVEAIDDEVRSNKKEIESLRERRDEAERKHSFVQAILADFQQRGYETRRSRFPSDFDVGYHLEQLMLGRTSAGDVLGVLQQAQYFEPEPVVSSSSSSSFFSSSDSSSSSSSSIDFGSIFSSGGGFDSSSGFSSGGGFGGDSGGFSTGGGF
jgi:DNA repair exonuclease SbcCD ATPase subunit